MDCDGIPRDETVYDFMEEMKFTPLIFHFR